MVPSTISCAESGVVSNSSKIPSRRSVPNRRAAVNSLSQLKIAISSIDVRKKLALEGQARGQVRHPTTHKRQMHPMTPYPSGMGRRSRSVSHSNGFVCKSLCREDVRCERHPRNRPSNWLKLPVRWAPWTSARQLRLRTKQAKARHTPLHAKSASLAIQNSPVCAPTKFMEIKYGAYAGLRHNHFEAIG